MFEIEFAEICVHTDATHSTVILIRRPCERRDPYAAAYRSDTEADILGDTQRRGLWVPAFAGTTLRERYPRPKQSNVRRDDDAKVRRVSQRRDGEPALPAL